MLGEHIKDLLLIQITAQNASLRPFDIMTKYYSEKALSYLTNSVSLNLLWK